ncbi:unnamed protein product [Ostreobium quekettii]|uniref:Cytochrome P450 n=1 Tax=Ostreobium quekettii TaxID=121088 RepID=A0A8S1IRQ9_9CHLO|nr:unnamed protein product [Ostreobium quekettii]
MEAIPLRLVAAAALLAAFVAGLASRWRRRAKYDLHRIPGPSAYPIVGNLPQMFSWKAPRPHLKVLEWMKEYGNIVKVSLPGVGGYHLFVGDPEYLQNNVTGYGGNGMPKSPFYKELHKILSPVPGSSIFTSPEQDDHWKSVRKGVAKAFSTAALKDAFPRLVKKADELVRLIRTHPSAEPIEVERLMLRYMFDALGVVGYDIDFKSLKDDRHPGLQALEYCSTDVMASATNPFRRLVKWAFPTCKLARDCRRMYAQIYAHYDRMLAELKARGTPAADDMSIGACLMRLKNPETGAPLDEARLLQEIATFVVGGTDTTTHQIVWVLLAIAAHPDVQQGVVDELKASGVFARIRKGGVGRLSYSDVMGLSYLGMAVKEAMRMFPAVVANVIRSVPSDSVRVCGYRVPKNTVINICPYALNRVPWLWDDPEVYDPERWRKAATVEESRDGTAPGKGAATGGGWAFSDGPRSCIAQRMALMQMHLAAAFLVANFNIR